MVVTGFSMGGWGSFVTYRESPDRFLGLAAFSGGTDWANGDKYTGLFGGRRSTSRGGRAHCTT